MSVFRSTIRQPDLPALTFRRSQPLGECGEQRPEIRSSKRHIRIMLQGMFIVAQLMQRQYFMA